MNDRPYRLRVEVSDDARRAIEHFRLRERLPSREAAMRELLWLGLMKESEDT